MKKSLAEWASIAEILGAIAIVISLVFVGVQIRSNTAVTRAATFQQHMSNEINLLAQYGSTPDAARVYWLGNNDPRALTDQWEAQQGQYLVLATYRLWEDFYLQHLSGTLSDDGWRAREPILHNFAARDMALDMVNAGTINGAFADYIRTVHEESSE